MPLLASETIWEDQAAACMARIVDAGQTAYQIGQIDGVVYGVYRLPGGASVSNGALASSDVFVNTPSTSYGWTVDGTGWNFRHVFSSTHFPDADQRYRIEVWATPTTDQPAPRGAIPAHFEVYTKPVFMS